MDQDFFFHQQITFLINTSEPIKKTFTDTVDQ